MKLYYLTLTSLLIFCAKKYSFVCSEVNRTDVNKKDRHKPIMRAELGTRTPDLLITNELLYQLS